MAKDGKINSRNKGKSFENQVCKLFRPIYPNARRLLENHADDANGVDLLHTGPYRIQCKAYKQYAPLTKIKEVQCEELLGEVPVLVTKGNNQRILVAIPIEEFLRLLKISGGK